MEKNQLILSVKDLNIKFNLRGKVLHAIRGIDLDIYHGEVLAIVGESGSGKSVFTKSFMGLLDANGSITSGTIDYYGADDGKPIRLSDLKKEKDWLKVRGHEIAMIMQDPMTSLNPLKTIGDQIMEAVELHQHLKGKAAREKTLEYLRDVGIADPEVRFAQYPHEFSGGMRQRVVIAIAVACNPQILICDEPTTALDVTIQAKILELIRSIQRERGISVIYITHDLGVVAKVADYVDVMYAGKIVETGTIDEIFYDCILYTSKGENHSMKHARKWLACLLAGALALAVLAGCSALMDGTVQKDTEQAKDLMKEVDPSLTYNTDLEDAASRLADWLVEDSTQLTRCV